MAHHEVQVAVRCEASADAAWAIVREFAGAWHPAIATITAERDAGGGLVRRFTVAGEDTVYRERLTYFSDSERCLRYRHVEGIAGVDDYAASLRVVPVDETACEIHWQATLSAAEPRASAIAAGTKLVFEAGIAGLARLLPQALMIAGAPAIALTVAGPGSPTLCLFLHGIGGRRQNWRHQLPVAARHMRAAAMDLRGYGDSALGPQPSRVDDYCADIRRVMAALGATRLVLCGLSYGSWIATSFAMRYPNLLAGLVLAGGCTGMSEAGTEERERFRLSREVPLDKGQTPADFAPVVVDVIASPEAGTAVRQELLSSMAAIPVATYRDALHCFTTPEERFDFSRLTMPVLFLTGAHDWLASPQEIGGVARRVALASNDAAVRFEVIASAGHVCNLEQPQVFNTLLEDFLKVLPR
jgi:pimeloyl-ACP methyl ester carboxylesterase